MCCGLGRPVEKASCMSRVRMHSGHLARVLYSPFLSVSEAMSGQTTTANGLCSVARLPVNEKTK